MPLNLFPELLPEYMLNAPFRQFPGIFSNLVHGDLLSQDFAVKGARVYEEGNHLHVEVPIPGLSLDDIEVSLNKGTLRIRGESKKEEEDKKRKFYRSSERNYSYSLTLPAQIDEKQEPQAIYENGVLNVSLQLAKEGETKKIPVKSGAPKK